jgi:hypothetical protein
MMHPQDLRQYFFCMRNCPNLKCKNIEYCKEAVRTIIKLIDESGKEKPSREKALIGE